MTLTERENLWNRRNELIALINLLKREIANLRNQVAAAEMQFLSADQRLLEIEREARQNEEFETSDPKWENYESEL